MLILPGRAARGLRSSGPFILNRDSPQAVGLGDDWTVHNGAMRNLKGTAAPPVTLIGSPSSPSMQVAEWGRVGHSEGDGAATTCRAFDTGLPGAFNGLTALTVAYWVNPSSISPGAGGSWWGHGDSTVSIFCETTGGTLTGPYTRSMGYDGRNAFTEVAVNGEWQLLGWTIGPSDVKYYRNGILKQTVAGVISGAADTAVGNGLYIGGQIAGSGGSPKAVDAQFFNFRVYRRALSAAEMWALYDPSTRWDLYWQASARVFFDVGGAAPSVTVPQEIGIFDQQQSSQMVGLVYQ